MELNKPSRVVDFDLLYQVKQKGCDICGSRPADPCHVRSRGAGGPDTEWNVIPMCRKHHSEQHQLGWQKFLKKYWALKFKLEGLGWDLDPKNGKLWNAKL